MKLHELIKTLKEVADDPDFGPGLEVKINDAGKYHSLLDTEIVTVTDWGTKPYMVIG